MLQLHDTGEYEFETRADFNPEGASGLPVFSDQPAQQERQSSDYVSEEDLNVLLYEGVLIADVPAKHVSPLEIRVPIVYSFVDTDDHPDICMQRDGSIENLLVNLT